jgi:hypothetical protein
MSIQAINTRIVERVRVHDYPSVQGNWKLRQNLSQGLLAQFGSSPSGGGERGQFADLLTRHAVHLLPEMFDVKSAKDESNLKHRPSNL